jgi:hypothetical protein
MVHNRTQFSRIRTEKPMNKNQMLGKGKKPLPIRPN